MDSRCTIVRPPLERALREVEDYLELLERRERGINEFIAGFETGARDADLPDLEALPTPPLCPWAESARKAAEWLQKANLSLQAAGIEAELAKFAPRSMPSNWDRPQDDFPAMGEAGQQVKAILTAVLAEMPNGSKRPAGKEPERRRVSKTRPSDRTEKEIRGAIEKALADLQNGKPVKTRGGRITKTEVANRCSISPDYVKNSEEWRFYFENGHVRPQSVPTVGERKEATELLDQLLPRHQHLLNRMAGMGEEERLRFTQDLTKALVPIAKEPADRRMELGDLKIQQFTECRAKRVLPLVTPPGKNTPAVPRF